MGDRNLETLVNDSAIAHLGNVTITVVPPGEPSYSVDHALYERGYSESEETGIAGYAPMLQGRESDLEKTGPAQERTQVWIDDQLFRVANREPDGTGWVVWRLERDQNL